MAPGRRSTDPADLPSEKTVYAMRDLERLRRMAAGHGDAIGVYATALLDTPLPWTKMRQVYALLGLVKKWGAARVEACRSALEHEVINVPLVGRMLERGTEATTIQPALPGTVIAGRFDRDPDHFAVSRKSPEAIVEAAFAAALEDDGCAKEVEGARHRRRPAAVHSDDEECQVLCDEEVAAEHREPHGAIPSADYVTGGLKTGQRTVNRRCPQVRSGTTATRTGSINLY